MTRHTGSLPHWVGVLVLMLLPLMGGGVVLGGVSATGLGAVAAGPCQDTEPTAAPEPTATGAVTDTEDCAEPTAGETDPPSTTQGPSGRNAPDPGPTAAPAPTTTAAPTVTAPEPTPTAAPPGPTTAPEPTPTAAPPGPTTAPEPTPTAAPPGPTTDPDPSPTVAPTPSPSLGPDPVEPQAVEVLLFLSSTNGEVGTDVTWTASVLDGTAPVGGATVHFLGQLVGAEDVTETLSTDETGSASFTHTRDVPGTETLTVTVESEDGEVSATRSFLWWVGNDNGREIQVAPQGSGGWVGDTAEFVATVTDNGAPVAQAAVQFLAQMPGQDVVSLDGTTGDDGTVTFEHSRDVPGLEDILVILDPAEDEIFAETTFSWAEQVEVELEPLDSSGLAGGSVDFVATVTLGGQPLEGETVYFEAYFENEPYPAEMSEVTDDNGVVTFHHSRAGYGSGVDAIVVRTYAMEQSTSIETLFTWRGPLQVIMTAGDGSAEAGAEVEWTATVSSQAGPAWEEGVSVRFLGRMEGQPDVDVTLTTDAQGVATYTHTRPVAGVEDLEVTAAIGEESASDEATFEWLEPVPVTEITVAPLDASGPIGEPMEFVATVTGDGEPLEGETVYFAAYWEGEEGGSTFLDGVTDESGIARFEHAEDRTGVQNIAVDTPAYGQEAWAETTFTWEPVEVDLTLEPLDSSAEVGSSVEFAATVLANGTPRPGVLVYFFAAYVDSDDYVSLEAVTDEDGVARFLHTRQSYGLENVIVSTYALENEVSAETTFTWRGPLQVQLSVESGSADVGTEVTWTATVSSQDLGSVGAAAPALEPAWEEGVSVRFLAQMAGEPDVDITLPTDANGIVSFTHTRLVPGTETALVTATVGAETATADTTFEWLQPDPAVQIEVEPRDAAGPVGQQVEFVATVTGDGGPLEGQIVYFSAQMESDVPAVFRVGLTGADGTATFEHSREVTGAEVITVETPAFGQEAWDSTTFTWEPAPPLIVLHQSSTSGEIGTPLAWSATVTSGDEMVEGASVRFLGQLSGQPDVDVTVLTDGTGVATYSHTRTLAGTESLMVGATVDDQTVFATGSFEWMVPVPIVEIEIQPADASGPVGTTQEFVAAVTVDGEPLTDRLVTFTATMAGAATVTAQGETDATGTARFDHSRSLAGVDTITVQTGASGQTADAQTTYTWQTPAAPPTLTLSQSGTSAVVGTDLVWTATVTSGGEPLQGANVRFLGQLSGDGPVDVTVVTNASGQATHTHSRSIVGTETLQVTATIAGQPLTETGSFTWLAGPTDPPGGETPGEPPTQTPGEPPTQTPGEPPTQTPGEPPTQTPGEPPAGDPPLTSLPVTPTPTTPTTPGPEDEGAPEPDPEPGTETEDPGPAPSTDVPGPPPASAPPLTTVALGSASATPGGDLEVTGSGCEPGSTVTITLAGETLATTTADSTGAFSARAAVANVPLGQYAVDVTCGDATGEAVVDLVSTAESSTAVASAASAAAVLTFFVLLGSSVFRSTFGSLG